MLALDADELDTEQLKWVVLMVLSSQPGQELAFERLGGSGARMRASVRHIERAGAFWCCLRAPRLARGFSFLERAFR